jgi:hypothetical protein
MLLGNLIRHINIPVPDLQNKLRLLSIIIPAGTGLIVFVLHLMLSLLSGRFYLAIAAFIGPLTYVLAVLMTMIYASLLLMRMWIYMKLRLHVG